MSKRNTTTVRTLAEDTTTVRTLAERPVLLRERLVPPLLLLCQWKRNVPKINPDISHQQGVRCQRPQRDTSHRGRSLYLLMDGFIYGWISLLTYLLFFNLLTFLFFSYFLFCLFPLICVSRSCCSGNHTESSISECFISSCLSPPPPTHMHSTSSGVAGVAVSQGAGPATHSHILVLRGSHE